MGLRMPSEKRLEKIINEVIMAKVSANPKIQEQDCSIRRYRDKLYCLRQEQNDQVVFDIFWPTELKQLEFKQGESLIVRESSKGISKALWNNSKVSIKFRKGSEKIKLPKRAGSHSLKNLYQEKAIPPWERNAIPLIYINDQLAAIADLWISVDFYDESKEGCYQLEWSKNNKDT
jgi:tRNA(Ile)-lysidine synthase